MLAIFLLLILIPAKYVVELQEPQQHPVMDEFYDENLTDKEMSFLIAVVELQEEYFGNETGE